ncbi:MAG: plasmid stabilization protein [Pseudorhodoplanes sp.]|nr:hypothetical protein [Pseudorhodoplanes sp.]MBW7949914.1 hypothetical protein [Pseudorhodoplanes sp.]MCL4711730.1 plasmid stabilization protein [Pseudorhodoplanes sp.]MCQ3943483.1 hypothetical protein [Alphaproteobacteria bacterium]GIK80473.1 MAG: hypothetical protein BroJett024_15780 [Alphaproteobacteria bacterium]
MATLTIRQLNDALVRRIKMRAAEAGRSMEEEVRTLLDHTYGEAGQLARQKAWAGRMRRLHKDGKLPRSDVDSAALIRQMREERDRHLAGMITVHPSDGDR